MKFLVLYKERKSVVVLVATLSLLVVILLIFPIGFGILRLGILVSLTLIYLGILKLCWSNPFLKTMWLGMAIAIFFVMTSQGKSLDNIALRDRYVQKLVEFDNVGYVWGGENIFGIDCSGLVREAIVKANLEIGISTANPFLIRRALEIWWFDAGADALKEGYRNFTHQILFANSVNNLDYTLVLKGDLAATDDGGHILAYEGDKKWIEASPEANRVIRFQVPEPSHSSHIYLLRWTDLI